MSASLDVHEMTSFLLREPAKRELYVSILAFISNNETQTLRYDIEEQVKAQPQYETFFQSPGVLIDSLVRVGALSETLPEPEYDEDTEEEYIDWARALYAITEVGQGALNNLAPTTRLQALMEAEPERAQGFRDLLAFCANHARTRREIDALLQDTCKKEPAKFHVATQGLFPSYYVDRLERCGGLVWKDGWTTTQDGLAFLAVFQ